MRDVKEDAVKDFMAMIEKSWTYDRMNDEERARWRDVCADWDVYKVGGTYKQRWNILQYVYSSFLVGLGYDGFMWRAGNRSSDPF